ncbi:MAG: metal ABC transporter permease [Pirellulales bacterium]|nr:metal ABC transporter permease [Pirellulales bacterium]
MTQFFYDMGDNPFLLTGLLAGLLASLACGVIGPYVVTRRIVFLSGAIAHMAVGGVGAAIWLAAVFPETMGWFRPLYGAILVSLAAAVLIGLIHQRVVERMDTLIGALWAVGMAVGLLLIKFTPGYQTELMSYLFGNIAFVAWRQVWVIVALDVIILATVLVAHKRLLAICLDQQQAELQGVPVLATNILLLCLVALTVIALTQIVGLILVIALVSLPAATAAHHVARVPSMMFVGTLLSALVTTLPRIAVYGTSISAEPAIVLAAACLYLLSVMVRRIRNRGG